MVVIVKHLLCVDGYQEVLFDIVVSMSAHIYKHGYTLGAIADLTSHVKGPQVAVDVNVKEGHDEIAELLQARLQRFKGRANVQIG